MKGNHLIVSSTTPGEKLMIKDLGTSLLISLGFDQEITISKRHIRTIINFLEILEKEAK